MIHFFLTGFSCGCADRIQHSERGVGAFHTLPTASGFQVLQGLHEVHSLYVWNCFSWHVLFNLYLHYAQGLCYLNVV